MTSHIDIAHAKGVAAFAAGLKDSDNPYQKPRVKNAWSRGWGEAYNRARWGTEKKREAHTEFMRNNYSEADISFWNETLDAIADAEG